MASIKFTLNGEQRTLSDRQVKNAMRGQTPGRILVHAVDVDGVYFPVKQALSQALQVPKSEFISTRAVELLKKVGLGVVDTDITGSLPPSGGGVPPAALAAPGEPRNSAALELAVTHLSSAPAPVNGREVLMLADQFEAWLRGASPLQAE